MLIREFLTWVEAASPEARADAAGALANAYLYADLDPIDAGEATRALTMLLDDPSPLVRRVLAEAFAAAVDAPRHILAALAADRSDIAAVVLSRSPALSEAELIDAMAVGDAVAQCAVAGRARISAALAGAIAEVGCAEAVLALGQNAGADLTDFAVGRMIERFGSDGAVRETLLRRDDLAIDMRHALMVATAEALGNFALSCRWMTPQRVGRMMSEACDRATVAIASSRMSGDLDQRRFAAYLRTRRYVTPALILRALLSGKLTMVEAIFGELADRPAKRVGAFLRNPDGLGFAALYSATGLPSELMSAFQVAFRIVAAVAEPPHPDHAGLDRHLVEQLIAACEVQTEGDVARLAALLRRFDAEAARDEARAGRSHVMAVEPDLRKPTARQIAPAFFPAITGVAA